jgi:hypothetical protein
MVASPGFDFETLDQSVKNNQLVAFKGTVSRDGFGWPK